MKQSTNFILIQKTTFHKIPSSLFWYNHYAVKDETVLEPKEIIIIQAKAIRRGDEEPDYHT